MGEENQNIPWWQKGLVGLNPELGSLANSQPQNSNPFNPQYLSSMPWFQQMSSTAMQGTNPLNPATNAAQGAKSAASSLTGALDSINKLMSEGKAIPESAISGKMGYFNQIEKDSVGNIIALSPKVQYGPGGESLGKIGGLKDFRVAEDKAGSPSTPRLDAMKARQQEPVQQESEASKANRAQYESSVKASYQPEIEAKRAIVAQQAAQSNQPPLPQGATAKTTQVPGGTERTITGPSGYAKAFIPEKKKEEEIA